jgi:hypothetical protein
MVVSSLFNMEISNRLYIYIDESGTLGLKKQEPFFVVTALIINEQEKRIIKNSAKRMLREICLPKNKTEIHTSELSFSEKQRAHEEIKDKNFNISYCIAHKESIHKNLFAKKNICFNYFVFLSLREILQKTHHTEISIIIDMRSVKVTSEKSLEEYLNTKMIESELYYKNIKVTYGDSKNYYHLQIVDLIANAIFARYNFKKYHFYTYFQDKILHRETFPQFYFDNKLK